jgi:hypothetical protein
LQCEKPACGSNAQPPGMASKPLPGDAVAAAGKRRAAEHAAATMDTSERIRMIPPICLKWANRTVM